MRPTLSISVHRLSLHLRLVNKRWRDLVDEVAYRTLSVRGKTAITKAAIALVTEGTSRYVRSLSLDSEEDGVGHASRILVATTMPFIQILRMRGTPVRTVSFLRGIGYTHCRSLDLDAGAGLASFKAVRAAIAQMPALRSLRLVRFVSTDAAPDTSLQFVKTLRSLALIDCALDRDDLAFLSAACGELEKLRVQASTVRQSETLDHLANSGLIMSSLLIVHITLRNAPTLELDPILSRLGHTDSRVRRLILSGHLTTREHLITLLPSTLDTLGVFNCSIPCDALVDVIKARRSALRVLRLGGTMMATHVSRWNLQRACWQAKVRLVNESASKSSAW